MSRRSPFVIELTKEEQAELDARSKEYTSPYREVMRAKIVLLASQGLGNDRIAARLGMPRQIISKWRQRFYYEPLPGLDDQPRGVDYEIGLRQLNVVFAAGCEDLRRRWRQVDQIALRANVALVDVRLCQARRKRARWNAKRLSLCKHG